jgi:lipopolysaccharide export system permease protein
MILAILFLALSLERLMRLVRMVTEQTAPVYGVFELIIYLLPHYLGLAIPAAVFFATMFAIRGLYKSAELVIMQAAGMSMTRLVRPLIVTGCILMLIMLGLKGYIQPHARYAYRVAEHDLQTTNFLSVLRPDTFINANSTTSIRTDSISDDGRSMTGFFAARKEGGGTWRRFFSAKRAEIAPADKPLPDTLTVILRQGNMLHIGRGAQGNERLSFNRYPLEIDARHSGGYGPRGQDEREKTFTELDTGSALETAALNLRLVHSLSVPLLMLLAVPLALLGRGRGGRAYGIVIGIVLLVGYEKILSLGQAYVSGGQLSAIAGLWGPFAALAATGIVLWLRIFPARLPAPGTDAGGASS